MNSNYDPSARIIELELQLMHLQKDFDALNSMVLKQGRRLDELSGLVQQLTSKLELSAQPAVQRDLHDEKPPHY